MASFSGKLKKKKRPNKADYFGWNFFFFPGTWA
jgi:hypothetical protein